MHSSYQNYSTTPLPHVQSLKLLQLLHYHMCSHSSYYNYSTTTCAVTQATTITPLQHVQLLKLQWLLHYRSYSATKGTHKGSTALNEAFCPIHENVCIFTSSFSCNILSKESSAWFNDLLRSATSSSEICLGVTWGGCGLAYVGTCGFSRH